MKTKQVPRSPFGSEGLEVQSQNLLRTSDPSGKSFEKRNPIPNREKNLRRGLIEKIEAQDETLKSFLDSLERDGDGNPDYPDWLFVSDKARKFCGYPIDTDDPTVSVSFIGNLANVFEKHEDAIKAGEMSRGIFACKVIDACMRENSLFPPSFAAHRDSLREKERTQKEVVCR
jgi:hypothetical protein